ncbi:hypothetical protein MPSEU_000214000 [Mayamaea pseudoterrestris]|nr:hypothetical protein MPSEU_000214000 [Mayamaea pseudoterrestris]
MEKEEVENVDFKTVEDTVFSNDEGTQAATTFGGSSIARPTPSTTSITDDNDTNSGNITLAFTNNHLKSTDSPGSSSAQDSTPLAHNASADDVLVHDPQSIASSKAVTAERKQQLILEARESRKKWLGLVPTPYETSDRDELYTDSSLQALERTYALSKLPTAAALLKDLYHINSTQDYAHVQKHIQSVVNGLESNAIYPTGQEILDTELSSSNDDYLVAYSQFWKALHEPSCSMLVESMRKTLRLLNLSKETAPSQLKSTITSMFSQVQQQTSLQNHKQLKRCLEALFYGQCYHQIAALYKSHGSQQAEADFQTRLGTLQFLTLKHLDANVESVDASQSIIALQSIDRYYSVYDKLQQVLALYHSVNVALRAAMQADGNGKGPSADDVLPTFVFVVIQARPRNIMSNLKLVEELAEKEYLRGEAGYAFTNLYGAVQFLLELDLEQPLNMSPTEWKQGMALCAAKMQERLSNSNVVELPDIMGDLHLPAMAPIPPVAIRRAREQGETVDLKWARRWHELQESGQAYNSDGECIDIRMNVGRRKNHSDIVGLDEILPPGFNRSYAYLTARPDDLRVIDLGPLLDEYRILVQATEALLAERANAQREQLRASAFNERKDFYQHNFQVDTSVVRNGDKAEDQV